MLPIKEYIKHPEIAGYRLLQQYFTWLPDKLYIQLMFRFKMGYWPDLKNPQTFSEKLQWLKLYNRRPEYTKMVDKYAVKEYVANIIGDEYIIPTLGVWNKPEDIEWDKLPEQFVLKTTHGGGSSGVVICKDKSTFDIYKAIAKLKRSMEQDIYRDLKEWPYKNVPKRIIAEKYISPDPKHDDLPDYKFFCFDGEVKALFIGTERQTGDVKFDYFDADFNHLDLIQQHPLSGRQISKPFNFEKMKVLASKLSDGIPQVRIDLYDVNGKVYFGEMTFFHHGGIVPFHPNKWDYVFGSWINLPSTKNSKWN